jgi:hypothetical protein
MYSIESSSKESSYNPVGMDFYLAVNLEAAMLDIGVICATE